MAGIATRQMYITKALTCGTSSRKNEREFERRLTKHWELAGQSFSLDHKIIGNGCSKVFMDPRKDPI